MFKFIRDAPILKLSNNIDKLGWISRNLLNSKSFLNYTLSYTSMLICVSRNTLN